MPAQPVRVVVLGSGSIGLRHARTLAALDGVQVTLAPVRGERVSELTAQGFHARPFAAALASRPDGVVVATDTGRHADDACAALAAGAHLLVEKPLAPRGPAAQRIVDEVRKARRAAYVAYPLRFDPGLAWMRARVPLLGRLVLADVECTSWLPGWRPDRDHRTGYAARPDEGGVLLDLSHELDYASWLLGAPLRVTARLANSGLLGLPAEIDESAVLACEHPGAVPSTIRLSYAVRPSRRAFTIAGANGQLRWDLIARRAVRLDADGQEAEHFTWEGGQGMYERQARAFVDVLRGATPDPALVEVADGARTVAVCDAARAAHAQGRWIELETHAR